MNTKTTIPLNYPLGARNVPSAVSDFSVKSLQWPERKLNRGFGWRRVGPWSTRNISAARERKPQVPRVSGWLHSPIYIRRRFAPRNLASYPPLFTFPSGFCCVVYIALHREGKPVPLKVPMNIQSTRDHTRKKDHIIYEERWAVFNFLIQILQYISKFNEQFRRSYSELWPYMEASLTWGKWRWKIVAVLGSVVQSWVKITEG